MPRATDGERRAVVALLRRHLIDGRIDLEEYTARVGDVWAADSQEAIDRTLIDLPLLAPEPASGGRRRHGEDHLPAATWRPTTERFRDPTTNRVMRVWVDVADGSRHYVHDH